ncbi:MAG TPA: hypothetical protein VN132_14945, partial [Bdellovibrio sp.]|nr:hypothetical protein [Bdellovibrio sp.]
IGKTYIYAQKKSPLITVGMQVNDFFFFKNILESSVPYNLEDDAIAIPYLDQSKEQLPLETITFDKNDPRIAGVLTTSRFLNRYQNTALNKNRRRSAAVFRSFLCDDMVAAIPAKTNDSERTDYDVLLPTTAQPPSGSSKTEDQLRKELRKNDPHGSLQGCMNCHYKLDPMGKTFALSASGLSAESSPGALVYKSGERNINIPVKGIGELAANIIQQKEYVNCQVNLFWKWFIGQDVPKTSARQEELVQAFEKGGRRPLDFISYLVQSREFKAPPVFLSEEQLLARKAAKVLRRCYDCHKDQTDNPEIQAWDLTDLPYGNDPAGRNFSVHQIAWVLDIPHDGAKKKMPPKESLWQLSPDEFETMKQWITQGAPDYSGQRQVP